MKGHMKDGKFHPHTEYKKGTRKSREQKDKTKGVKIRKQRGSLPSKIIHIGNEPPSHLLKNIEPEKRIEGKGFFKTLEGDLVPESIYQQSGFMTSTPFKHPTEVPPTERGFDPRTEEFDIHTDQFGNIIRPKTRTGAGTYSGGDTDEAEYYGITSPYTAEGEPIYGHSGERRTTRSPVKGERKKHDEMPLPILETGLDDIFDDVRQTDPEFVKRYGDDKIDDSKLTKAVGDNINYILKREKRLKNDEHISVGNISFREETEDDSGHYQYDYSVWKNNPRKLINKGGTAYGMISNGTLIDMKLELYNTDKMP